MDFEFEPHDEYLEVIVSGDYSISEALENLDVLREACVKSKHRYILIDVTNMMGHYKEYYRLQIGEKIAKLFKPPYKLALIEKEERINKFAENVAVNRGADFFVTHDRTAALDWLLAVKKV